MPFQVDELVPMSLALRDTCLGIIELVHPDTRPTLKEDYKKAFQSVGIVQNSLTAAELQEQQKTWAYVFKVRDSESFLYYKTLDVTIKIMALL